MAGANDSVAHKHFRLDTRKLKRAQKLMNAKTETEAVERALDLAISEHQRNGNMALLLRRCAQAVLTSNRRDFARLAGFCPVQWQEQAVPSE